MRVDAEGTLLAVNEAGLGLLRAESLDVVLGTNLLSYLTDETERPECAAFFHDAAHSLRGSREVTLRDVAGHTHIVEIHAVAYPASPDQTPSVSVTLRDVSRTYALTQSLIDTTDRYAQVERTLATLREQETADLAAVQETRERVECLERERDAARQALAGLEGQYADLERALQTAHDQRGELERSLQIAGAHQAELEHSLQAAHAQRGDLERAIQEQRAAANDARSALAAIEASSAADHARAEAEIAAARDDARRAREAWSGHESVRRDAEQRRHFVEEAVTRLAVEIGLFPSASAAPADGDAAQNDGEPRSAW
jgi:chromosome segregation ATPase